MSEGPTLSEVAAQWRETLSFVEGSLRRANYEYVSKNELRIIAIGALSTLHSLYSDALKRAEEAENTEKEGNKLVVTASEPLPGEPRIIVP